MFVPRAGIVALAAMLSAQATMLGCRSEVPTTFPTAAAHPEGDRQPDGVAVDLTSEPPPAKLAAHTDAGVVTLRTPRGVDDAKQSVRGFFAAVESEDVSAMNRVMDYSALLFDISGVKHRAVHSVSSHFRQRFRKHDLSLFGSRLIYREGDITTYRGDQLGLLPRAVRDLAPNEKPGPTDVVLEVPIVSHTLKSQRVFGNVMFFWLRLSGGKYRIYRLAEDVPI